VTAIVHELLAGITAPVPNVTLEPPAAAATVPPQVLVNASGEAITTPLGNKSVSGAVSVAGVAPMLLNVIVRVELLPSLIVAGVKDLPSVIGDGKETVKVAATGAALLPLLVFNAPAPRELI